MIINILSDLHLDFYFPQEMEANNAAVKSIFDPIFFDNRKRRTGDVLIVAGDIGHYNHKNLQILRIFQAEYYKHIVCVLGNHDYYLNGNVVDIDGIKFGGCDSSYSDAYLNKYFNGSPFTDKNIKWKTNLYDYKGTCNINYYDTIYKLELPKIEVVYKECDVMITHVNPSYLHEHIAPTYKNDENNMFFTFDGHRFMKDGAMKYWVFGHTHNTLEYEHNGVKCICNPFGYPAESCYGDDIWIKSIEI